jgi:hypothetical protein
MRQVRTIDEDAPMASTAQPVATRHRSFGGFDMLPRVIAVIAGCVPLVVGLIAVARVDWSANGFSSPPVIVWHMVFTPWVAVATAVAGLIIVAASATVYRTDKLVVGVLSAAAGFAILVAKPTVDHEVLARRYGLMFLIVGLVVVAMGLLMGLFWRRSTTVPTTGGYAVQ